MNITTILLISFRMNMNFRGRIFILFPYLFILAPWSKLTRFRVHDGILISHEVWLLFILSKFHLFVALFWLFYRVQKLIYCSYENYDDSWYLAYACLVVEVYQAQSHCYDLSCCYHKWDDVLLELFYHSVDKYLAEKCCQW